jgi:hypothetical protein
MSNLIKSPIWLVVNWDTLIRSVSKIYTCYSYLWPSIKLETSISQDEQFNQIEPLGKPCFVVVIALNYSNKPNNTSHCHENANNFFVYNNNHFI